MRFLIVVNAFGLLVVIIAWYRTSGVTSVRAQLGWLNLALAGLLIPGIANGKFLLHRRRGVLRAVEIVVPLLTTSCQTQTADGSYCEVLVSGPQMTRYHRADCLLVQGKQRSASSPAEFERAGRVPCEACEP